MNKLIGLSGPAGSGKDTAGDWFESKGFTRLSWAAPLKQGLAAMGFPEPTNRDLKEAQIDGFNFSWREAAQRLGTEWGRSLDTDIWLKIGLARTRQALQLGPVVITDVRFENEAAAVRELGGTMVFISGRKVDLGCNQGHASEAGILFYPASDELVDNSSTLEYLHKQLGALL